MNAKGSLRKRFTRLNCLGTLIVALGACSAGGSALPATTPIPAATVQSKTANANGIALEVPGTWITRPHTEPKDDDGADNDPWTLHMTDPHGDAEPVLAISDVLPTTSAEQAYQAASALLSSGIPGYQAVGVFTFPTPVQPDDRQPTPALPSPTGHPEPAASSPSEEAAPAPTASTEAARTAGMVARIAFTYRRGEADGSGTAWTVPADAGYVVVVLLDDDDATRMVVEASLTGGGT
ncbi:hypothetical protein [Actinomyces qiguomingii]|uniref:hypothetical protein n=1 Tax=Actinomyces qiguomingii TaxID=2057800 RepID=UPI000CA04885|nr:hypothetical protein [Actinomyces qiguomingii]